MIFSTIFLVGVVLFVTLITFQIGQLSLGQPGYGTGAFWLRIAVTVLMIGIGGFQTLNIAWALGVSPERKSAISLSAANIDITQAGEREPDEYPNVPRHDNISNSPGVCLRYRLPVTNESLWSFAGIAFLCLILLAIASALSVVVINRLRLDGSVNWVAAAMIPVFVGGSVWAIVRFLGQVLEMASVGPAHIEISHHPLVPGNRYRLFLYQSGLIKFRRLDLVLACFEHVTYQQGTDVRTESRRVAQKRVLRIRNLKLDPARNFEHITELYIPENAMHSFQSPCNMVSWVLILTAVSNRWPRISRRFPVIVYPRT